MIKPLNREKQAGSGQLLWKPPLHMAQCGLYIWFTQELLKIHSDHETSKNFVLVVPHYMDPPIGL